MRFHLTYEGPLLSTQKDPVNGQVDARAGHKHDIRRQFHSQLKQLWATNKFLRENKLTIDPNERISRIPDGNAYLAGSDEKRPMAEVLASQYNMFGYRFVPLVRRENSLSCSIEILFLRRDAPGAILRSGDIDNRLKTLFDGLRLPQNSTELGERATPDIGEDPFFCLLEDDSLITRVSVDTDVLLDAPDDAYTNKVRLILAVEIRPYHVTMSNLSFA